MSLKVRVLLRLVRPVQPLDFRRMSGGSGVLTSYQRVGFTFWGVCSFVLLLRTWRTFKEEVQTRLVRVVAWGDAKVR
jgi:hypothetical protein